MSSFNYQPDFVFEEALEYKTLVSEFESGIEQRRRKWSGPLRRWTLRFRNRVRADMEEVRDFFKNRYGAFEAFAWINPNDEAEYTVRFAEDSFKFSMKAHEVYDFDFEFVEVR